MLFSSEVRGTLTLAVCTCELGDTGDAPHDAVGSKLSGIISVV